jgi:Uma2 family endonuclease
MMTTDRPTVVIPADWVLGPKQGDWTYSHYVALPDDGQRYEVVDGVLYLIEPAQTPRHQQVLGHIAYLLFTYVEDAKLGQVFIGPVDVELVAETVVQPDVLVLLNEGPYTLTPSHILGRPDLVVEVASPATVGYDWRIKYNAYARAGVPEYWIVDPYARTVEILILAGESYQSRGVFSGSQALNSVIVPTISAVRVEQFFV